MKGKNMRVVSGSKHKKGGKSPGFSDNNSSWLTPKGQLQKKRRRSQ
jgi:hypothetical protein